MSDAIRFDLPKRETRESQPSVKLLIAIMIAVLLLLIANIVVSVMKPAEGTHRTEQPMLSADQQKQLALKLEKQNLENVAAEAWKEYIKIAGSDHQEVAKIWYRIGKLYQKKTNYEKALDSFYRSESVAKIDEISFDISRRIQECLESMGKFSALRYELSERVGVDTGSDRATGETAGDQVIAEIGTQKITKSDLDNQIEMQIDRQLSQFASYLPDEERKKQKEQMLKQFSTISQRKMFLNRIILEEILYRHARETNLTDDLKVRDILKSQERSLLAKMVIDKELADKIQITPGDLETYYEAHKDQYVSPERRKIAYILVDDENAAKKIRRKLKNGKRFEELAAGMSGDTATKDNGGEISGWIEKGAASIPGIGTSSEAMSIIFSTEKGQVAQKNIVTENGVYLVKVTDQHPGARKPFDEVKNEVFRALRSQKENEVQQRLITELKNYYDVVIHQSALIEDEHPDTATQAQAK